MAAIAGAWLRKNVFQPCDGDPPRTMYFDTVDWATSKPSINSSPWIRDTPHFGFSLLMRRIRSRNSRAIFGPLPAAAISSARTGQPHHQGPVTAAQSKARRRTPQGDAELMAKEQVLGLKSARRLEEVDNEHCERVQEREHRRRSCNDSTRRGDSQAGWNFRKAQLAAA